MTVDSGARDGGVGKTETREEDDEKRRKEQDERTAKEREELSIVLNAYPTIPDVEWWDTAITAPHPTAPRLHYHYCRRCTRQLDTRSPCVRRHLSHVVHLPSSPYRSTPASLPATSQARVSDHL